MRESLIGMRLRSAIGKQLKKRGLDEADVRAKAGMTLSAYNAMFRAKRGPSILDLCAVTNAIGCSLADLVRDEDGFITITEGSKIAQNVGRKIERGDITEKALASRCGWSVQRLSDVLRSHNPGVSSVLTIARALDIPIDELLR